MKKQLLKELTEHLPYSIFSVILGIILVGLLCFTISDNTLELAKQTVNQAHAGHDHQAGAHDAHEHGESCDHGEEPSSDLGFLLIFHLFHPAHMLFSAAATAGIFRKYEKTYFKPIVIGLFGSVFFCGLSDILIPHVGGFFIGSQIPLHFCMFEQPGMILTFSAFGILLGIISADASERKSTIFSHSMHVWVSTMASILYIVAYTGRLEWINHLGLIFMLVTVAVVIPCCFSDIIFPIFMSKKARHQYQGCDHHHH